MLIGTAVCGKPHVRWCERVDGVKRPSLYFNSCLRAILLVLGINRSNLGIVAFLALFDRGVFMKKHVFIIKSTNSIFVKCRINKIFWLFL